QITANRLGLVDFNVFAAVLSLHRGTGGNFPTFLHRLAAAGRDPHQFHGQYRAPSRLGPYCSPFIVFLGVLRPFFLFFFLLEWAMKFFDTSYSYNGIFLFCTAMVLEVTGLAVLIWFLRHDY